MKYEYGTGEVILLQVLDYFHQKAVELEGAAYRANELKKIYDALHEDYVQKCAEYNALNKTYEAFSADFNKMCEERDAAVAAANCLRDDYNVLVEDSKKLEEEYSELEKDYNDLRKTTKKLQAENDQHLREWSMQHVEKQAAERLATDMESNYQSLLKEYDKLYEEKEKLEGIIRLLRANQNVLVEENENLKGLLHAEAKIDEEAYTESWEKAGY